MLFFDQVGAGGGEERDGFPFTFGLHVEEGCFGPEAEGGRFVLQEGYYLVS